MNEEELLRKLAQCDDKEQMSRCIEEFNGKKTIRFPTYNVNMGDAWLIVKERLDDETIAIPSKVLAIEKIARMETHNSITKDDLVRALRWLFDHYDFDT